MINENTLITKAKAGDREALNTLIARYWHPVYRLIYGKTGNADDAKELTQETLMKSFRSLAQYEIQSVPFKTYIYKIAVNVVTDFWRKNGRAPQLFDITDYQESLPDTSERPEDYTIRLEKQSQIRDLVETLPADQRQAIKMRVLAGVSVRETAAQMNKTESAVKMLQQRALKNLRKMCLDAGILA